MKKRPKQTLYILMSYTTLQLKFFSFELIYCFKMCFEIFFAQCKKKHSTKSFFVECQKNTRQRASLPSVKKNTRQRRLCRVPEKQHSANHLALGKEPVSGSDYATNYRASLLLLDLKHDSFNKTILKTRLFQRRFGKDVRPQKSYFHGRFS